MASGPPTNARVNSARTRALALGPPDIGFGQRIRNATIESNSARPSPAPTRKTQSATARVSPNTVQRPAQSSTPRSTNNSPSQPKIAARLPSSSTLAHLPSTRSPTIAFNSRIARPRAISTTSPTTPTGLPSRVRTLSSITPSTKSHLGSPVPSSIKSLNTSSASSTTTPRPSNSVKPSPRPTPTFRLATDSGIVSLTNSTSTKSIDNSTKRDSLINARGSRSEVGQKRKTQSTQSSQNNVERNTSEVTSDLSLSAEDVDMLKGVWEDTPVNPDAFDPGESSTVDRAAIKSGYGSVFGFNMVSKSRNSLAEGFSEDRSQSASSIGSTLSHFSVETTKIVSPVPSSPADQPGSQAAPELASSIPSQPSPPSPETTAPSIVSVSPTAQRLHSNSSMLQSSLPSQSTFLSPDSLDVYTAVRYLRTSVSSSGLRSEVPSEDLDRMNSSSRPSGSMSRVSLPVTARSKPKSTSASHVTPSTRVIPGSSRTPFSAKDSSTQQTKDRNVSVARASRITAVTNPSEYLPTPLHPDRTVVIRAASPEESTNHKHPTELSSTVDSMSSPPYVISHSFTGQSYGQRHTSSASPMSSNISPTSSFGLPADLSGPSMHSYSPPGPSPTHPPTVNLKRLLSKPAPAGNSSASESEGGAITMKSQSVRRIERIEEKKEKQRIEAYNKERALESDAEYVPTLENSRERDRARKTEWEAERRLLKERNLPHSRPATSHSTDSSLTRQRSGFGGLVRSASWSRSREREGIDNTEKKAKKVLKKRPSAVSVAAPPDASKMEFPYSSFAPAYTGSILPATRQVIPSGSLMPPTSGHSSSRGSSPAPQDKRRSLIPHSALLKQGIVSDDGASISSGTTPAKEIMLAYKQQQEREKIRERERNERALEKQRERELWQQEDKDRQQRALEDQALFASRNISSIPLPAPIPKSNFSRDKIPTEIHSRLHQPPSAPNSGAASDHSRSVQPSNPQLPSQPGKGSNEAESFGEEPSQPYYTVLGSSRRVVAAEGIKIQDSFLPDFTLSTSNLVEGISSSMGVGLGLGEPFGSPENEVSRPPTQRSASVTVGRPSLKSSSSFSIGIGKTLSRKMSGRLGASKRGPSFDITSAPTSTTSFIQENIRPSLHERRMVPGKESGNSSPRADKRSLRLSMDDYATTKGALSSPKNSPPTRRTQEGGIRSPLFKSSLVTSPQPSPTSASSHSSSKNKIWNLMKRISTGALRDNYRDTGAGLLTSPLPQPPPPPVPALPKDFSVYPKQMMRKHSADVTEIQTLHKRNATLSTIQSPNGKSPSAGSIRAPMIPARINASSGTPTSTSTRAGTATRSSSPISSSDIGSSKFFNRSQSQRSSSSSYGEQIPPVPAVAPGKTVQLQQHILPPSELYQLHLDLERNNDDSQTRPVTSSTNYAHSLSSLNTTPSIPHPRSQVNLKLQTQQKSSSTEEWMIVPTPKEEKPAFSLPIPRRPKGSNNTEEVGSPRPPNGYINRPASPTIHMLSNEAMISSQASTSGTYRTSQIGGFGLPVAPASIGASSIYSAESGLSGESSLSRLSSPPAIPLKSPRRMTSASSASSIVNTRILSSVMPPLPTTQSPAMPGRQQKLPEEHMKTDVESPSRRGMRKSFGFGTPSERYPVDHVRKRTNSNSSRPRTSPAAQYSSTTPRNSTPSRLPRSETLQNSKSHTFGALSDKEKDDKWDDLLERSKRAGGTLHLNGGSDGLASDKLGFSVNDSEDDM